MIYPIVVQTLLPFNLPHQPEAIHVLQHVYDLEPMTCLDCGCLEIVRIIYW